MQCPVGAFMTNIMISPFIGKVAFLGINCAQPDTSAFQQYSAEGCLNIDLGYENKCPEDFWFAGMDLTNGEQIICCQPVYTCREASSVFPSVKINWLRNKSLQFKLSSSPGESSSSSSSSDSNSPLSLASVFLRIKSFSYCFLLCTSKCSLVNSSALPWKC